MPRAGRPGQPDGEHPRREANDRHDYSAAVWHLDWSAVPSARDRYVSGAEEPGARRSGWLRPHVSSRHARAMFAVRLTGKGPLVHVQLR